MSRWLPSRAPAKAVSLGLSTAGQVIAWRTREGELEHLHLACTPAELPSALEGNLGASPALARALREQGMRVTVAEDLLRWWLVQPPVGTASLAELEAFARIRYEEIYAGTLDGWTLQSHWHAVRPSVCCAMPTGVVQGLHGLRERMGVRLLDVAPASQRLLDRWQGQPYPDALVCLSCNDRALIWWFNGQQMADLRTLRLPRVGAAQTLAQELARYGARRRAELPSAQQGVGVPWSIAVLEALADTLPLDREVCEGFQWARYGPGQWQGAVVARDDSAAASAAWLGLSHGGAYELVARH